MLKKIESNIKNHGHHNTLVSGGLIPRFAYTIGLSPKSGAELILPGSCFFSNEEVSLIINSFAEKWEQANYASNTEITLEILGNFSLLKVDNTWSNKLLLGALDYFNCNEIECFQIIPEKRYWTIDIPNMSEKWDPNTQPVWQWLYNSWDYPISENSIAFTNMDALRGEPITEAMRWEVDEWELFSGAGPDVEKKDIRLVSLATLLAVDKSLSPIIDLDVGKGIWRDYDELKWNDWG